MEIKQHVSKKPTGYSRNQRGNKNFLETNDNENMTTQNLWDVAKAVLRGMFIAIQSYLKKQEKYRLPVSILFSVCVFLPLRHACILVYYPSVVGYLRKCQLLIATLAPLGTVCPMVLVEERWYFKNYE